MKKVLLIAALTVGLAGCETLNSVTKSIDDTFASVNDAMGGAPITDTPAEICSEIRANKARATNKYMGKTIETTGRLTSIEQNLVAKSMSSFNSDVWGSAKQFDVRVTNGQTEFVTLITKRPTQLDEFNLGDSVTIKGRIESVDGGNKGCRIELASDPKITKN